MRIWGFRLNRWKYRIDRGSGYDPSIATVYTPTDSSENWFLSVLDTGVIVPLQDPFDSQMIKTKDNIISPFFYNDQHTFPFLFQYLSPYRRHILPLMSTCLPQQTRQLSFLCNQYIPFLAS